MEEDHVYEYDSIINNNNVYVYSVGGSSSSFHNNRPPSSSDEISLLLHQILYRSSPSSTTTATTSSSGTAHMVPHSQENAHRLSKSTGISAVDPVSMAAGGMYFSGNVRVNGANVSSSSVGVSENENTDEHDCRSEGVEPLLNAVEAKPARPRCSSKRSRAAEVHNLTEKRRRSRINEKMKALQNLVPNSNKTDKASMLDEAIEYLKHLQLQVQVLTVRNGIGLHPICVPGAQPPIQLPQMTTGFGVENESLFMNSTGTLVNRETPMQNMFNLPNQLASSNWLQLPNVPSVINSETSFWVDSSIQANLGAFHLGTSSGETGRVNMLPHEQLNASFSEKNPPELHPFSTQGSDRKDSGSFEACMIERDQAEGAKVEHNVILSPHLNSMQNGRSFHSDHMKQEINNF